MTDIIRQQSPDEAAEILLVEDNPGDVRLIREAFAMAETDVETDLHVVTGGEDAVTFLTRSGESASGEVPDLVLLDLNLPGMDGCGVLETLRGDSQIRRLPVIVLTSSSAGEDVERCYDARANAYVTKPTKPAAFVSVVESIERFWLERVHLPPLRQ